MKFRLAFLFAAGLLASGLAVGASQAQERMVEGEMAGEAIKYRVNVMRAMGAHMGAIAAILQGKVENKEDLAAHGAALGGLAGMYDDLFPKGSVSDQARIKPELFEERDKVNGIINALAAAGEKLAAAASSGDMAGVGQNLGAMGQQCGACHRAYRLPQS